MSRGRINPGQRLETAISARAWNRAQDAADVVLGDRGGQAADGTSLGGLANTVIRVRNDSGFSVPMHGVLMLTTPVVSPAGGDLTKTDQPASQAKEFLRSLLIRGVTPTANASRFCVLLEPLANGAIGRAAVSGVLACKVKVTLSTTFPYAVTRDNDRTQLVTSACGPVRLLWHETVAGDDKWALALL